MYPRYSYILLMTSPTGISAAVIADVRTGIEPVVASNENLKIEDLMPS